MPSTRWRIKVDGESWVDGSSYPAASSGFQYSARSIHDGAIGKCIVVQGKIVSECKLGWNATQRWWSSAPWDDHWPLKQCLHGTWWPVHCTGWPSTTGVHQTLDCAVGSVHCAGKDDQSKCWLKTITHCIALYSTSSHITTLHWIVVNPRGWPVLQFVQIELQPAVAYDASLQRS